MITIALTPDFPPFVSYLSELRLSDFPPFVSYLSESRLSDFPPFVSYLSECACQISRLL